MLSTSQIQIPPDLIPSGTDVRAAALATLFYRVTYRGTIQALIDTGLVIVSRPGAPPQQQQQQQPAPALPVPPPRPPIDPAMLQALTGRMNVPGDVGQKAKQQILDQVWATLPPDCQQIVQQAIAAKQAGADPLSVVGGAFQGEAGQLVRQLQGSDPIAQALGRLGSAPRIPG